MEENVFFRSGLLKIEGLLHSAPGKRAAVLTHPHPLYGGDMTNNVVESLALAFRKSGYTTLRFNFRGSGRSEGAFDEGIGEQDDVSAAIEYLREQGKSSVDLAGYSFGAWVNAMGFGRFEGVDRMIMVSPPVNFLDFSFFGYHEKLALVIAGSHDDIGPPRMIQEMLPVWNPKARFDIIQGADHFYLGKTERIEEIVRDFLENEKIKGDGEGSNG